MKYLIQSTPIALAILLLASCQKSIQNENLKADNVSGLSESDRNSIASKGDNGKNFVYTLSNQTSGNEVVAYSRATDGMLTYSFSSSTGGNGTGGGLGNQGAVVKAMGNDVLLAVNPGSNSISALKITGSGLNLKSVVNSGGMTPVSITQHGDLVYVLNAGGAGNISGFRLGINDKLTPIANSTRPLSSMASGAAQISFMLNGTVLVITEKATNKIITYTVDHNGVPQMMHSISSASPTPFGFATGKFGNIYVSEAVGGAPNASNVSSYHINADGSIALIEGPVATGQSAACWAVLTHDGSYVYTTNTASNTLSSFDVQQVSGNINLQQSIAGTTQMGPIDAVLADNSNYLYILNGGGHSISVFAVAGTGNLTHLQTITGVPVGATGLAVN
ncbi:MAG: beta-propeller fold lactonase family protein [Chitinophagaceae bacterium]